MRRSGKIIFKSLLPGSNIVAGRIARDRFIKKLADGWEVPAAVLFKTKIQYMHSCNQCSCV
jgi:hypothetical protein